MSLKKIIQNLYGNSQGATLVVSALCIPVALVFFAFVLSVGTSYLENARLQSAGDSAAEAGSATVSDILIEKATARESNPPHGADPRSYVLEPDVSQIANDSRINSSVQKYLAANLQKNGASTPEAAVSYPNGSLDCTTFNRSNVDIVVSLKQQNASALGYLLVGKTLDAIKAVSHNSFPLCPRNL